MKCIFMVLYRDDIFLDINDINILHDRKKILSTNLEIKDLGDASMS